jgi:hypothetical protein
LNADYAGVLPCHCYFWRQPSLQNGNNFRVLMKAVVSLENM